MTAPHTPGPWHINESYQGDKAAGMRDVRNGEGRLLAWVPTPSVNEWGMAACEANARLIAAAPDLLDTLQFILRRFEHAALAEEKAVTFAVGGVTHREIAKAIERATATGAIAKAAS